MIPPKTCGECPQFKETDFLEQSDNPIGYCWLFPYSSTRRAKDQCCGFMTLLAQVVGEVRKEK